MKILSGLREIVARYDLFIVDQYGVLHNGTVAHPGAVDCFQRLVHDHGKRVVILSNTSRRACGVTKLLTSLGFTSEFHGAVTGGEAAWEYLRQHSTTMAKCALMTSDLDAHVVQRASNAQSIFHGLDHLQVTPVDQADFLLVEGSLQICYSDSPSELTAIDFHTTGQWNAAIEAFVAGGLARGLPLVCTNPDLVSIQHGGHTVHMGGKIAQAYEARGGRVLYFGKPLKEHFDACIALGGASLDRSRVVHIGDSMQHDVQGAMNAGVDSVFIGRGIHAHEVLEVLEVGDEVEARTVAEPALDRLRTEVFVARSEAEPTFALAAFTW